MSAPDMRQLVENFHRKFGFSINRPFSRDDVLDKRLAFMDEELRELKEAIVKNDKPEILKELCDLLYILFGFAVAYGLPVNEGFRRVHESNMSKSIAPDDGKAIKGTGYIPARMDDLFTNSTQDKAG
jgi:predicted HAD superfamily Cof-like phosphohydrolase